MPIDPLLNDSTAPALPIHLLTEAGYATAVAGFTAAQRRWIEAQPYRPERGRLLLVPGEQGQVALALAGLGALQSPDQLNLWDAAALVEKLPAQPCMLATALPAAVATQFTLGWLLGAERPARLTAVPAHSPTGRLLVPTGTDLRYARSAAAALLAARELINRPANLLGPAELAEAVGALGRRYGGQVRQLHGEELAREFPLVQAVGAGSARPPRLVDIRWPRSGAARVTLIGKGVCFDSGGLDIKPSASMLLMKKDMGGAACALALAELLLAMSAPLDLRLLIPAAENSIGGRAFRPGDVYTSRKGLTVEIGNTDAEGRLILADAIAAADEERPDLIIDLATLTGAARTALGPELPAVFGSDQSQLDELRLLGASLHDPLWPLPLWPGYEDELMSRVADLNNASPSAFAGAITAALFLKRFITRAPAWLHVDLYAWNAKERPGRPQGAEPQAVRALYALLRQRYG